MNFFINSILGVIIFVLFWGGAIYGCYSCLSKFDTGERTICISYKVIEVGQCLDNFWEGTRCQVKLNNGSYGVVKGIPSIGDRVVRHWKYYNIIPDVIQTRHWEDLNNE